MYKDFNFVTWRSNNIVGTGQFIRNIVPRLSCLGVLGKKMTLHGDGSSTRRYLWVNDAVEALLKTEVKFVKIIILQRVERLY